MSRREPGRPSAGSMPSPFRCCPPERDVIGWSAGQAVRSEAPKKKAGSADPAFRRKMSAGRAASAFPPDGHAHEQPVVEPQVSHFRQVPLRTMVKFWHSGQASPS